MSRKVVKRGRNGAKARKDGWLLELLQDGGSLPGVTVEVCCAQDWQRVLMDAHADLARQLCFYMEGGNELLVDRRLERIEAICRAWREKGPKE